MELSALYLGRGFWQCGVRSALSASGLRKEGD